MAHFHDPLQHPPVRYARPMHNILCARREPVPHGTLCFENVPERGIQVQTFPMVGVSGGVALPERVEWDDLICLLPVKYREQVLAVIECVALKEGGPFSGFLREQVMGERGRFPPYVGEVFPLLVDRCLTSFQPVQVLVVVGYDEFRVLAHQTSLSGSCQYVGSVPV